MTSYNNMKKIREIYGATQDEIAKVAGVTRSTISQWENDISKASNTKLEQLSIFYGIGPESFYEIEDIDDTRKNMLIKSAEKEKMVREESENDRNKAEEFAKALQTVSFPDAMRKFMYSMKLMLATADNGKLEDLKTAYEINQKMAVRLKAIIEIREEEEENKKNKNVDTLFDLLDSFSEN